MMLRASSTRSSYEGDIQLVINPSQVKENAVPHAATLLAFAEAVVRNTEQLPSLRNQMREEVGIAGTVDAAGVIGNFQRMNRVADATGIPLDPGGRFVTANIQDELSLRKYNAAIQSKEAGRFGRWYGRLLLPIFLALANLVGRLLRKKPHT